MRKLVSLLVFSQLGRILTEILDVLDSCPCAGIQEGGQSSLLPW